MEELEEKTFKEIYDKLVQADIIKSGFKGSLTLHFFKDQIAVFEVNFKKDLLKKKI